jgi:hypothetical protein
MSETYIGRIALATALLAAGQLVTIAAAPVAADSVETLPAAPPGC